MYPNRFILRSLNSKLPENVNIYDGTVGCMYVCDNKDDNISFLNDFWFSTNLNGGLYNKYILLNAWKALDFHHPGDLEGNWYFLKARLPRYHLMLTNAVIITNDGYNQTRPDHLSNNNNNNSNNNNNKRMHDDNVCTSMIDMMKDKYNDIELNKLSTLYKKYENSFYHDTRIFES